MADVVALLDIAGAALSGAFALLLVRQSYSAYVLTRRPHLVNFAFGFACLAVSYFWLMPIFATVPLADVGRAVRVLVVLLGFSLIASSYLTRDRRGSLALLAGIFLALGIATLSAYYIAPFSNDAVLGGTHLLETVLVGFVAYKVGRAYTQEVVPGGFCVLSGFGLLAVSQYSWAIWSYLPDSSLVELATGVRLVALASLVFGLKK